MSIIIEAHDNHKTQNGLIEWDTVRGRGNFDAGYVNEFNINLNEKGEIDEEKRKKLRETSNKQNSRKGKAYSSGQKKIRRKISSKKSIASDSQLIKNVEKPCSKVLPLPNPLTN